MPHSVFASYAQADRDAHLERFIQEFQNTLGGYQGIDETERQKLLVLRRKPARGRKVGGPSSSRCARRACSSASCRTPTCGGLGVGASCRSSSTAIRPLCDRRASRRRFVFPIWWPSRCKPRALPSKLDNSIGGTRAIRSSYPDQGVRGLARHSGSGAVPANGRCTRAPRRTIRSRVRMRLPAGTVVADVEEIVNAFDEQQALDVRLLALTSAAMRGSPARSTRHVGASGRRDRREKLENFPFAPWISRRGWAAGLEKAQSQRQILLLVVDASLRSGGDLATFERARAGRISPSCSSRVPRSANALRPGCMACGVDLPRWRSLADRQGRAACFAPPAPAHSRPRCSVCSMTAGSASMRAHAAAPRPRHTALADRSRIRMASTSEAQPHLGVAPVGIRLPTSSAAPASLHR